jgi:prepilin-type N-terminal cleavage/methylation domain-containing protein
MSAKRNTRAQGFTLVELMIVVAIIGVLAAVAIPSFQNYQLTSKRAEAFANLSALGRAQKSYYAEFSNFVSGTPEPGFSSGTLPISIKRDKAPIGAVYAAVGWEPDGDVFYDYDTATPAGPLNGNCGACTAGCFTSSAYGDLDGDGLYSIMILAHPDPTGNYCTTGYGGNGGPFIPPVAPDGSRMLSQVARIPPRDGPDDY